MMASSRPNKRNLNPLQRAINDFITSNIPSPVLPEHGLSPETLPTALPKRFTIYEPMLLLSPNGLNSPPEWGSLYASLDNTQRQDLHSCIVGAFRNKGVTHLAINAPIASTDAHGEENRMRSPVGLVPLHGDFGPRPSMQSDIITIGNASAQPNETNLQNAFWVRTVQNQGIVQIWAPVYTMFSRGNVTEKARILGQRGVFEGLDLDAVSGDNVAVVDMYAGIGYFVFSYLRRGVRRVWGWEINGWSVEGLRRGCRENGWGCRVVTVGGDGRLLGESVQELVRSLDETVRVVIFHGDNRYAPGILDGIRECMNPRGIWSSIRHVNLGLLPSSIPAWDSACRMVDSQTGGWVHVHENVDTKHIEQRKGEILAELSGLWCHAQGCRISPASVAECRHVELVKTYAPGVMHCVFDIQLFPRMEHGR